MGAWLVSSSPSPLYSSHRGTFCLGPSLAVLSKWRPSSPGCFPVWLLFFWVSAQQSLPEGDLPWPPNDSGPSSLPLNTSQHWLLASHVGISLCVVHFLLAVCLPTVDSCMKTRVLSVSFPQCPRKQCARYTSVVDWEANLAAAKKCRS